MGYAPKRALGRNFFLGLEMSEGRFRICHVSQEDWTTLGFLKWNSIKSHFVWRDGCVIVLPSEVIWHRIVPWVDNVNGTCKGWRCNIHACWLVLPWISREGTKDNLINVATEIRTRSPQDQTRIATALTVLLGATFVKYVHMTNNVRSWVCIKMVFIKSCNNIYECTDLCVLRSILLILLPFPPQRVWRTTRFFLAILLDDTCTDVLLKVTRNVVCG
jgi:hypothetical protein